MMLTDRYAKQIRGVVSCFDRMLITGTLPGICYPDGISFFLRTHGIRIFDYPSFVEPLRDEVRQNAERLAQENNLEIEFIRSAHAFRKEARICTIVARTAGDLDRVAGLARAMGRRIFTYQMDVTQIESIPDMTGCVVDALGSIDILVNAAGVIRPKQVLDVTRDDWDYVIRTNLQTVFFISQAVARVMIPKGRGKIINIGTMTTYKGMNSASIYGITKVGVASMTWTMALEWAPYNIQVNAIAPGFIDTKMTASMKPERRRWAESLIPQGSFGKPRDLARMAVYLASSAADYTTGQVFPVDEGYLAGSPGPTA
jgi:NAD(P)-dependent dehydrogenase (short-subunit alcohol dehydrogenase family)